MKTHDFLLVSLLMIDHVLLYYLIRVFVLHSVFSLLYQRFLSVLCCRVVCIIHIFDLVALKIVSSISDSWYLIGCWNFHQCMSNYSLIFLTALSFYIFHYSIETNCIIQLGIYFLSEKSTLKSPQIILMYLSSWTMFSKSRSILVDKSINIQY